MRIPLFAALTATLTPFATAAQIQFEGRVTGTMTAAGNEITLVQHLKGSKMRVDMTLPDEDMEVSQIFLHEDGTFKMLMLAHDQKMWMDLAKFSQMMPGASAQMAAAQSQELPELRRTERFETIAGRQCRHYVMVLDNGVEVDVCAAPGLGCFIPGAPAGLAGGGGSATLPQNAELWIEEFEDGFFVLKLDGGGATFVVEEVEPGSPPDELFVPPADYTEMSMPMR